MIFIYRQNRRYTKYGKYEQILFFCQDQEDLEKVCCVVQWNIFVLWEKQLFKWLYAEENWDLV